MPSAKDRMKKYRERLKEKSEKHAEHLQKERERDRKRREADKERNAQDPNLKAITRQKIRDRVRAYREKLKAAKNIDSISSPAMGSYKCLQTFGKAVRKLKNNLPDSPLKKEAVVKKLASEILGWNLSKHQKKEKIKDERAEKAVRDFYYRDDISRQSPGIKDYKTVKDHVTGKKTKKQKRHMVVTIREAYECFKDQYPDMNIGKSAFYSLRPAEVLPVASTCHVVCVCAQHSNIINKVESVGRCLTEFPKTHTELINSVTCSPQNEACMLSLCNDCPQDFWDKFEGDEGLKKTISWKEWANLGGRPKIETKTMSCKAVLKQLKNNMEKFKIHCYVKKVQSISFEESKKNLQDDEAVIQLDFAENYALVSQDEIQSAHWSHDQVTLFTCCIWLSSQEIKPVVIVSDDTSHTKYAVWTFLKHIFDYLKEFKNSIKTVRIFSDNCAAQFKNRFVLALLSDLKDYGDFDQLQWEFFAASHGKGAVDGLGGTVKRVAWTGVKARKVILNSAEDFYLYVKREVTGIHISYVSKIDIDGDKSFLDSLWKHVLPIKGIQAQHHFKVIDDVSIAIARTSTSVSFVVKIKECAGGQSSDYSSEDLLPLAELEKENLEEEECDKENKQEQRENEDIREQCENEDVKEQCENEDVNMELWEADIQAKMMLKREAEKERAAVPAEFSGGILESVCRIKRKLRFSEVYSDSEDECDSSSSVHVKDINAGVFVLVRILAEGKKKKEYRYAGICQSSPFEGDVQVMFLKKVSANTFICNEKDISDVLFPNIICTLPCPELIIKGDRTYYSFSKSVDVIEQ